MATVLDEKQIVVRTELLEACNGLGEAEEVHGDQRPRAGSKFFLQIREIRTATAIYGVIQNLSPEALYSFGDDLANIGRHQDFLPWGEFCQSKDVVNRIACKEKEIAPRSVRQTGHRARR